MAKKNAPYFDDFITMMESSCKAAEYLHTALVEFEPKTLDEHCEIMHQIENDEDTIKHDILERLAKEFITPIDREDIIELANELDDVTDSIEDILIHIRMYNIKEIREDALVYADIITRCCKHLLEAVREFPNYQKSKTIKEKIIKINTIEEEGDRLYIQAVSDLFKEEKDPIAIIAWNNVFDLLEDCCDSCEGVANTMEMVIMKNS